MSDQEPAPVETSYEQSPEIGKLAEALATAQGEIENAAKDSINPHFRSSYADLASVRDACRDPLSKAKIAVVQQVFTAGADVGVRTVLAHSSGQWMACTAKARPTKPGPQELGSVVTYLRRYSLSGMVCIGAEVDDDGESGQGRDTKPQQREKPPQSTEGFKAPPRQKLSPAAVNTVRRALDKVFDPVPKEKGDAQEAAIKQRVTWIACVINREPDGLADLFEDEAAKVMEAIDKRAQGVTP